MSDFTHFTLTYDDVTGKVSSLAALHPYLGVAAQEAPTDAWVAIVKDTDTAILDAIEGKEDDEYVTVAYPKPAVAVMLQAVSYVDRLLVVLQEEVDKAIAKRQDGDA